jgi:hypothetical protein
MHKKHQVKSFWQQMNNSRIDIPEQQAKPGPAAKSIFARNKCFLLLDINHEQKDQTRVFGKVY